MRHIINNTDHSVINLDCLTYAGNKDSVSVGESSERYFFKTMLRLGAVRDELSIVGDQIGCPTYAQDIAKAIVSMMTQLNDGSSASGTFHYCGDQLYSWYEFARVIFEEAKMSGFQTPGLIHSIQTSDYPTAAERSGYSALDCHKIRNTFGINTSDWKLGVKNVVSNFHLVKF